MGINENFAPNPESMKSLKYIALVGNTVYILWILRNGIDEGFKGIGTVQAVSLTGLVFLLILNIILLWRQRQLHCAA
jgi:hypothetical protein